MTQTAAAIARLLQRHPPRRQLTLLPMRRLLARLGHPERGLPPAIHVAGTNGKGSVTAFCDAMLRAGGRRVHRYTSPHLVAVQERITLDGTEVEPARLLAALHQAEAAADHAVTAFELLTAAAALLFAEDEADLLVLETGLGGRFDATRPLARPLATVITRISGDHRALLGPSLASIARHKAGIMRTDVPCIVVPQPDDRVRATLVSEAGRRRAPLLLAGRDWQAEGELVFTGFGRRLELPPPALAGRHQIDNAGAAIAALLAAQVAPPTEALARGLRQLRWPGRLQKIADQPFELWLDGGHNDSAGEVLAEQACRWAADGRPLVLVLAMGAAKEAPAFLAPLAPLAARVIALPLPGAHGGWPPDALAAAALAAGCPDSGTAPGLGPALASVPPGARVLVTGSLFLVGAALAELAPPAEARRSA